MRVFWRILPGLIVLLDLAAWILDRWIVQDSYDNPAAHQLSGNPCPGPGHSAGPTGPIGLGRTLNDLVNVSDGAVWVSVALAVALIIWCAWRGPGGWRGALTAAATLAMIVFAGFVLVQGVSARAQVNTPTSCPMVPTPGR